jgi:hypothetical protein
MNIQVFLSNGTNYFTQIASGVSFEQVKNYFKGMKIVSENESTGEETTLSVIKVEQIAA